MANDLNPYQPPANSTAGVRREAVGRTLLCLMPLVSYGYVLAFWSLASLVRERWLEPGVDDPSEIFFGIPMAGHYILQTMAFVILPILLLMARLSRFPINRYTVFYLAMFALSVILFRLDLYHTTSWIAD